MKVFYVYNLLNIKAIESSQLSWWDMQHAVCWMKHVQNRLLQRLGHTWEGIMNSL
jgi:hypothetical protein